MKISLITWAHPDVLNRSVGQNLGNSLEEIAKNISSKVVRGDWDLYWRYNLLYKEEYGLILISYFRELEYDDFYFWGTPEVKKIEVYPLNKEQADRFNEFSKIVPIILEEVNVKTL